MSPRRRAGTKGQTLLVHRAGRGAKVALLGRTVAERLFPDGDPTGQSIRVAGFALVTGVFFGFYPALKASRLAPAEALRAE